LKSATNCCQAEWQIQQDAWGSACIACVAQQCLSENCWQMIENEQWPPNNSPNMNILELSPWSYRGREVTHEAILKSSSEAYNTF